MRWQRAQRAALALVLVVLAAGACAGQGAGGDGGGSDGGGDSCRFLQPECAACISTSCPTEASDCYGDDWEAADLCSSSGASASCQASSAQEGLDKQLAYGGCVASNCLTACE